MCMYCMCCPPGEAPAKETVERLAFGVYAIPES